MFGSSEKNSLGNIVPHARSHKIHEKNKRNYHSI